MVVEEAGESRGDCVDDIEVVLVVEECRLRKGREKVEGRR